MSQGKPDYPPKGKLPYANLQTPKTTQQTVNPTQLKTKSKAKPQYQSLHEFMNNLWRAFLFVGYG